MPTGDYRDMAASSVTGVGRAWPNPSQHTTLGVSHIIGRLQKPNIDELKYVDKDIAEEFRKAGDYTFGVPTMIQLNRNIEKLLCLQKAQMFLRPDTE